MDKGAYEDKKRRVRYYCVVGISGIKLIREPKKEMPNKK